MRSTSRDIAQMIEDASLGYGVYGTDLFNSKQPDEPDMCITVYDSGGDDPMARYVYDKPFIQIRMRDLIYDDAYSKLMAIRDVLQGKNNVTVSGTRYIQILQQSDIVPVGYDDKDRPELTLNFAIHRTA